MNIDDCYQLGYVVKIHGTKGGVVIFLDVDDPSVYYQMESVLVQKGTELVPFFIEGFEQTNQPNKLITYFEDIFTIEEANALKGLKLYLPLTELPTLEEDQFYYHDVVGYQIKDDKLGILGEVKTIYEMPTHDMIVTNVGGEEVMIPIQEPLYQGIDKENKIINVSLPEGYVEVFTSDPNQKEDEI